MARRKKAGSQRSVEGIVRNIENIRIIEENKSIMLNGSPVKRNRPFMNRRPEQKRTI